MKEVYVFFVGNDWAWDERTMCVLGSNGEVIDRQAIQHSGAWSGAAGRSSKEAFQWSSSAAIGIEMPRGAILECLVERGFAGYSLNPKQMDRFRDRHG